MPDARTCWRNSIALARNRPPSLIPTLGRRRHTRMAAGYNVQVAVDDEHELIVEQQVMNPRTDVCAVSRSMMQLTEYVEHDELHNIPGSPPLVFSPSVHSV